VSVHLVAETAAEVLPGALTFVVIGVGAFLLPLIARRIRVPAVVLEILYGLLIGPAALGIIGSETVAEGFLLVLAELGLLLLMFLAGFEIDFARLEREGSRPIVFGLIFYGLIVAVAWVGFGFVGLESVEQQVFMTLLVSAAALGVIVPVLRSGNRVSTRQGQAIIVIGVLAEFLAATGIVVFSVWIRDGFGLTLLAVPLFLVIGVIALVAMRRLAWWYPERAEQLFTGHDPDEMGIRASLALLFVFVGLSLALGIDPILGAFFAGAMFAYVFRNTGELETRLAGFGYGFFVPIFFIAVGVRFPVDALRDREVLALAFAVIVVAIAAKVLPSPLLMVRGLSLRDSLSSGVLLAGQLSVIIALAEVGVQIGVIDEGLEAGAILLVGVTAVLSPIVFRAMSPPLPSESTEAVVEEWDR
jgi:Kef-type K+ transport system membrane component KefB